MGKKATPQKGIMYTFRFRNEKKGVHYTTLLFEGRNDKGRLVFYNYESKAFTTMRDDRFSYIHRFNLVKEEKVEIEIKEVPKHLIDDKPTIKTKSIEEYIKEAVEAFNKSTPEQRQKITAKVGMPAEVLLREFVKAMRASEEDFKTFLKKGIMSKWSVAESILK